MIIRGDGKILQSLRYENESGETVNFTDHRFVGWSTVEGLDGGEVEQAVSRGYKQHGSTLEFLQLAEREIVINFWIDAPNHETYMVERARLLSLFSPLEVGRLYYEDELFDVYCTCHVSGGVDIECNDIITEGEGSVTLVANDPILWDRNETQVDVVTWTDGWDLAWTGGIMLKRRGKNNVTVTNDGHLPVPCRVEFKGSTTDPIVWNDRIGEYISLKGTVSSSEKVIITTGYRDKAVLVESGGKITRGENRLTNRSNFFQLVRGENPIRFSTAGDGNLEASLFFRRGFMYV